MSPPLDKVLAGDSQWHVEQGDALSVLREMPDASIDVFMFSPPYWSLRSYLPDDDPNKAKEMGSEAGPGTFLDALLEVVDECYRVLARHGSLFLNLGDTYAGSGGPGGDYNEGGMRDGQRRWNGSARVHNKGVRPERNLKAGPLSKSLCAIPEATLWALAWGRNPWTGTECKQWRVRNRLTWCKPSPPVGRDGDKWRPASELIIAVCKEGSRYFNEIEKRVPADPRNARTTWNQDEPKQKLNGGRSSLEKGRERFTQRTTGLTAPMKDWWVITSEPLPEAHFAAFPTRLVEIPLKVTCPERVCRTCGEPSYPIIKRVSHGLNTRKHRAWADDARQVGAVVLTDVPDEAEMTLTGWTDCGHNDWRPGIVCDPFTGSGTTGIVARRLNRAFVGIELSDEYVAMGND